MMASSSEKELVEKLSQSGIMLSTPPSSTPELLSLLEKVESELRSTSQDPSVSMKNVLEPIRKVLIGTKLLGHCDETIKVSVVCCICQIMRISAPLQPYDNPDMKVVFHHIIASLEKLDDVLSECYSKAVRVLEAVARIRMCVMLLDIDYVLAVNVFQLFLKIIRPYHPHAVLTYMEDIMTQLIEESDEVSIDFQVSILESLRKKTLDTAPLSSLLGHHVLEKCAARLKPCLLELMKTMNMNFDDYSDVLGLICREVPEGENKVENALQLPQVPQLDVNNNNLEPDGSLKTLNHWNQAEQLKDADAPSDPMHKNTKDLHQQMNLSGLSEEIRSDKGHDCFEMNERKTCVEEPTYKKDQEKKSGSSSHNAGSICREVPEGEHKVENAGSVPPIGGASALQLPQVPQLDVTPTTKNNDNNKAEQLKDTDAPSDPMHANTNNLQQQMNLSGLSEKIRPDKGHDCFGMNESKSRVEEPTNKKEQEKKSGNSSDNAGSKESALPSETGKQSMPHLLAPNSANTVCPSSTASGNTHISSGSSRKRGRPKKNQTDVNVRKRSEGTSSRKRGRPKKNEASPSLTVSIKKEEETVSDAEKSSLQRNDLQALNNKTVEQEKKSGSTSDNAGLKDSALPSETGKSMPDLVVPNSANTVCQSSTASRNTHISSGSSRKRGRPKKNEASPSLTVGIKKEEETVSGADNLSAQRNDLQNISTRAKHSRKQALSKEKDSKKIRIIKDYGKELVGAKVRVWWPLDRKFYEGVISSFDHKIKKHTVRYTDDDEEILNLNRECWELVEEDSVKEEPVTDFPPEVSVAAGKKKRISYSKKKESGASSSERSGKKTRGSGSKPGKSIKSEKASTEDNSTTDAGSNPCANTENNPRIKEEAEEESTVPSYAFRKEPATDFPPEVSATALKKKRKGSASKKKESSASSSERSRKKARGSGSKPEKRVK